jgi:hypothetical protein
MIRIIEDLSGDRRHLDGRIEHVTEEIEALARGIYTLADWAPP